MRKLCIGLIILWKSSLGFSYKPISKEEAIQYIKKQNSCLYAIGYIVTPDKDIPIFLQKSGHLSVINPVNEGPQYTDVWCILNGETGDGIRKKKGCTLAKFVLDNNSYQPFYATIVDSYLKNKKFLIEDGDCTIEKLDKLFKQVEPYIIEVGSGSCCNLEILVDVFGYGLPKKIKTTNEKQKVDKKIESKKSKNITSQVDKSTKNIIRKVNIEKTKNDLIGTWESCVKDKNKNNVFSLFRLHFSTDLRKIEFIYGMSENCQGNGSFILESTDSYNLSENYINNTNLIGIDYIAKNGSITLLDDQFIVSFIKASACNKIDWQIGEKVDINNKSCKLEDWNFSNPVGKVEYSSFLIESNRLFFGKTSQKGIDDGETKARRQILPDMDFGFSKLSTHKK